jgi:hypothetical protein
MTVSCFVKSSPELQLKCVRHKFNCGFRGSYEIIGSYN